MSEPDAVMSLPSERSSQCPNWGTPQFRGCKFCRRSRTCPNPLACIRASKPLLQFRSERHGECLPCVGSIRTSHKTIQNAEQHAAYAKKLQEDDAAYEQHMLEVSDYEAKLEGRSQSKNASRKRKCNKAGVGEMR